MRDYAKIPPQFWIDVMGKKIKALGIESQLIALYLMSCPHATMLGIYYLPIPFISHELGIPYEGASKALQSLIKVGFCTYDAYSEYLWVHDMALSQIGGPLKPTDNRVKSVNEIYQTLPKLPFLKDFFEKYHAHLQLEKARENTSPLEGPCKPLLSQKQEQEQKQDEKRKKQAKEKSALENIRATQAATLEKTILKIFEYWKTTLNHPNAKFDDKRKRCIRSALALGFSVSQLEEAISGCAQTPHNLGHNERGERYDGLHVIFKNADNIERFIRNCHNPPTASANKNISSNPTRKNSNEVFAIKQYTQTPLAEIDWINSK